MAPARFPDGVHHRSAAPAVAGPGRTLRGHAALFGVAATIGGAFSESILPGAFARSLAGSAPILALVDHDPGKLLGRTSSGTLRLEEDSIGLAYEIEAPDTQLGNDLLTLARRGDLGGMSFGFRVIAEDWPSATTRILRQVELIEVSVVHAWPAYAGTTVAARHASPAPRRAALLKVIQMGLFTRTAPRARIEPRLAAPVVETRSGAP